MARSRDTVAERFQRLAPAIRYAGPSDILPRPAVLFFHGCGGLRTWPNLYADRASALGARSFAVDSYGSRGWSRAYAASVICTGARFRGAERAGDVLAAVQGIAARADVDESRLLLIGASHGAWAIMDLMTMPLTRSGEAGLADPTPAPLAGVRGLYLLYPWVGPGALSRRRAWLRTPAVQGVIAGRDHLASPAQAEAIYAAPRTAGASVTTWLAEGATHGFDLDGPAKPVMRHHPEHARESASRFEAFARDVLSL